MRASMRPYFHAPRPWVLRRAEVYAWLPLGSKMVVRSGRLIGWKVTTGTAGSTLGASRRAGLTPSGAARLFEPELLQHPKRGEPMRRCIWSLVGLTVAATSLGAQGLRDKISELFIFTAGKDPLFLGGTADPSNPATIPLHANHFIPSPRAETGSPSSSTRH